MSWGWERDYELAGATPQPVDHATGAVCLGCGHAVPMAYPCPDCAAGPVIRLVLLAPAEKATR